MDKCIKFDTMINHFNRYQVGLTLNNLYPTINGKYAFEVTEALQRQTFIAKRML